MSTGKLRESDFFSERLKSLRKGSNKAEFSRFLGIPPPMYHRYEQGQIPKEANLRVIADRCGVTVDWLLGRTTGSAPAAPDPRAVRESPDPCHYPGEIPAQLAAQAERLSAIEKGMEELRAIMISLLAEERSRHHSEDQALTRKAG